eukprot:g43780.t1
MASNEDPALETIIERLKLRYCGNTEVERKNGAVEQLGDSEDQGSVLRPLPFVMYINDLDVNVEAIIIKFADDSKIGGVDSEEDGLKL